MHVSVEEISSVKKVLHIEIPETSVKERMDDAYRSLKKNTKLKGFRPGKVPRSVLERMFQKDVNQDVFGKLIEETFTDAIRKPGHQHDREPPDRRRPSWTATTGFTGIPPPSRSFRRSPTSTTKG